MFKHGIPTLNGRTVQLPPKVGNPVYSSPMHMAWANEVRKRAGHACQQCGKQGSRLYADHIVELRDGGTWDIANGQALCASCHTNKTIVERFKRGIPQP